MNRRDFLIAVAALPTALAIPPSALGRAHGGTPLALVTADRESSVLAVSLGSGRIERRIRTLPDPRSIESAFGSTAVVAHSAEGAVTIVDGVRLRVRAVLRDFGSPRYTAVGFDEHAYVTDSGRGELVAIDLARARIVGRVALPGPARHVTIEPVSRTLWVALGSTARELAIVDATQPWRPRLRRLLRPPFLAHDVGFAPDGRRVWVTSGDRRRIAVLDGRDGEPLFELPHGTPPQHVTFAGGRAFVTSGDDGLLTVHRPSDGRVLGRTGVPLGSYNVATGWGVVLTPSLTRGTLCVLDRGGRTIRVRGVARAAHDACFVMSA
jgi:DNA-binding beta-propeller fold protein YncE